MPKKAKSKPKPSRKLTQKERFIEAARKAEADETGETFERIIRDLVRAPPPRPTKRSGQ